MEIAISLQKGRWVFTEEPSCATGADLLFDYIADGKKELKLLVSHRIIQGATELIYDGMAIDEMIGAYYYIEYCRGTRIDLLVYFTDEFLFIPDVAIPKFLYIKPINT